MNYVGRVLGVLGQGRVFGESARWTAGVHGFTTHDRAVTLSADFGLTGNSFRGQHGGQGLDTQLNLGRFDLAGEYLRVNFRPLDNVPAARFVAGACSAQAAWFFIPKEGQAVVRFDLFDPNGLLNDNETDTWAFGVNWLLKGDDLKLQANYLSSDVPALPDDQRRAILRAQVIF